MKIQAEVTVFLGGGRWRDVSVEIDQSEIEELAEAKALKMVGEGRAATETMKLEITIEP